jgi:hypothetical protein
LATRDRSHRAIEGRSCSALTPASGPAGLAQERRLCEDAPAPGAPDDRDEDGMKAIEQMYHRRIGDELAYICDRLKADEVEILGKALRRGLLEIYKAVVLNELATGRIDRKEASHLLGSRVVERSASERRAQAALRPQRPGPRKMPRRRNR